MTTKEIKQLIAFQVNEATENIIYRRLAKIQKQEHNRHVLEGLSREELRHYHTLQKFTGKTPGPNRWRIFWYVTIARLFGLIFGIKLMEKEKSAPDLLIANGKRPKNYKLWQKRKKNMKTN